MRWRMNNVPQHNGVYMSFTIFNVGTFPTSLHKMDWANFGVVSHLHVSEDFPVLVVLVVLAVSAVSVVLVVLALLAMLLALALQVGLG
jgi:amino acid transporter